MGLSETSERQQNLDHKSQKLGTRSDESMSDQVQALSLHHGEISSGRSNEVEEEIKRDQDVMESYSEDNNGDQSEEKQRRNGVVVEGKEGEDGNKQEEEEEEDDNEGVYENGNGSGGTENKGRGVEVGRREKSRVNQFPLRPEAEDCSFYLRTGTCKFGMNCKFNHPPKRKALVKDKTKDEHLEGTGVMSTINCKYYDRPGGCKFGRACKFSHSNNLKLNFLGLPIRLGEKECPYYIRSGSCKYGSNCRFNHPDPAAVVRSEALPVYSNSSQSLAPQTQAAPQSPLAPWSPQAGSTPYMPLLYSPAQGIPSSLEWNAYRAPLYPPERSMHLPPAYVMNGPTVETNIYTQRQQIPVVDEFPERPGQPECSYYMRTGDCKYRSSCKFHHPKNRVSESPSCVLNDLGLPLRPGQGICSFYSRYGICKYGPACKYDHPENYARSETSEPDQSSSLGNVASRDDDGLAC